MKKLPKALHYSLLLMILGVIVGSLLAYVNGLTAPVIEENKMKTVVPVLEQIVPKGKAFKMVTDDFKNRQQGIKNIFIAYSDANQAEKIAVIYWVETTNQYGSIETLVAIDLKTERFIDLKVVSSSQTVGYGDVETLNKHDFKIADKSLDTDIDAFTKASHSSKSVREAVSITSSHYKVSNAAIKGLEG